LCILLCKAHVVSSVSARVGHVLRAVRKVLLRKRGQQMSKVDSKWRPLRRTLPLSGSKLKSGLLAIAAAARVHWRLIDPGAASVIAHSVSGGLFATHSIRPRQMHTHTHAPQSQWARCISVFASLTAFDHESLSTWHHVKLEPTTHTICNREIILNRIKQIYIDISRIAFK
jgi:hypothetical protein